MSVHKCSNKQILNTLELRVLIEFAPFLRPYTVVPGTKSLINEEVKMEKRKILVSAYACEPYKGSEIGVGWHWILEMSKYYELWVVTRSNNKGPIESYFKDNTTSNNIHFIYFDLPEYILKFKKGMKGVRIYYNLWQIGVNRIIKETMLKNNIEIFHLLTYGNALWTISKYGQKKFFIWGPTGGVDAIPKEFSKKYDSQSRQKYFVYPRLVQVGSITV